MHARTLIPAVLAALLLAAPVQAERLANYFFCTLEEGKAMADLVAFKAEYEKAVQVAGLDGYELRLQVPMYNAEIGRDKFVWDGSWADFEQMAAISAWFRASEWPARFDALMTCDRSSLWRVID